MKLHNLRRTLRALAIVALAAFALPARAQVVERLSPPPTIESDNFLFNLGLTAGYRSAQVTDQDNAITDWAKNRYYEAANFRDGINVTSFNIFGERKEGQPGFFDEAYLTANGINDPFTDGALRVRAFHKYDLKVDFRQAKYFLDRINPTSDLATKPNMIYSGLHNYDFTRQFINGSLGIEASEDLKFTLKYSQTNRSGNEDNTYSPSMEGSDEGLVGGFARGNFFWVNLPLNDKTNEFSAEANYKIATTTSLALGGGYRQFSQDVNPSLLDNRSLNFITDSTSKVDWAGIVGTNKVYEPLSSYKYDETRKANTPFGYLELVSRPIDDLSITANFRVEATKQDGTILSNSLGQMGAGKIQFRASLDGTSQIDNTTMIGALAVDGRLIDGLSVGAQYRYTNLDQKSTGDYTTGWDTAKTAAALTAKAVTVGESSSETSYKIPQHYIQGFVDYRPLTEIGMRGGVILNMRQPNVDRIDVAEGKTSRDSAFNVNMSKHTTSVTPYFSFNARPISDLKLNGRYSHTSTKATFNGEADQTPANLIDQEADIPIRIIPKSKDDYSVGLDYQILTEIGVGLRYIGSNGTTTYIQMVPGGAPSHASQSIVNPEYTNKLQRISASVNYDFMKNSSLNLSYEQSKNDMTIPTTWTRGIGNATRPYGDSMTIAIDQHTTDNYFDATIETRPIDPLGVQLGFSYLRSTGGPTVTSDVVANPTQGGAAYAPDITRFGGPYTWYQAHAQLTYDVTTNVGLQFDFHLYSLKEDKVDNYIGLNNFKASLYQGGIVVRL